MKRDVKNLSAQLTHLFGFAKRYAVMLFFVVLCAVYGFLAYRINSLTSAEPDPSAVSEKLQTVPRPRIDEAAIDKMRQLEARSIEVKTLFDDARNNPFSE